MSEQERNSLAHKGRILLDQGRYQDAVRVFKDGLARNPEDASLFYYLALSQYHIEDQKKQSLQTIQQALQLENDNPAFFYLKALILADLQQLKEAMEAVDQALAIDAEYAQAYAAKGYILCMQEKWAEAEKFAKHALSIDADNPFAGNILANALRMQNKLEEGVHLTSEMLAKDPDDSFSHSNAGWVYLHKKNYDKAQEHFKEALRLDPCFEPARAGMLEAFKAKSAVYAGYLQYCLFMSRQTKAVRIAVIIGVFLLFRVVSKNFKMIFQGEWAVVGYGVIILFYLFFFWTWLSEGIGNLLVLKDKAARYALNRAERLDAVFVGGGFFLGIALLILNLFIKLSFLTVWGVAILLATIPFSVTFKNPRQAGRLFYGLAGTYLLVVGLAVGIGDHVYGKELPAILRAMSGFALVLFVISSWLAAFGFLREK